MLFFKKELKFILCILFFLLILIIGPPNIVKAATITQISSTEMNVTLHVSVSNGETVQLPNGVWIYNSTNYTVNQMGVFYFYSTVSGYQPFTVSGLYRNYLITGHRNVNLKLYATDTLSNVQYMQFNNQDTLNWTGNEPYTTSKDWSLSGDSGLKTVSVIYTDTAGNKTQSIYDKIILDLVPPIISNFKINDGNSYTTSKNVTLDIFAFDTLSNVSKIMVSNDNSTWSTYSYSDKVNWTLTSNCGQKYVYIKCIDGVGNISDSLVQTIYYDDIIPEGTVLINDGAVVVDSRDVNLKIHAADYQSGIKSITISEGTGSYTFTSTQISTISASSDITIPWRLTSDATGQVSMTITDMAGNIFTTKSNIVKINIIIIKNYIQTNIVNPLKFNKFNIFNPLTWPFSTQEMMSGANISWNLIYLKNDSLGDECKISGDYIVQIIKKETNGTISYDKSIQNVYHNPITSGFTQTITLPADAPNGSEVYITSTVVSTITIGAHDYNSSATFPGVGEKARIGVIIGNIKKSIKFNELN